MRRWAGTISAKMGLLQAGAAQLLSRPQVTMATEYIVTVIGSPLCGSTCSAAVAHASAHETQHGQASLPTSHNARKLEDLLSCRSLCKQGRKSTTQQGILSRLSSQHLSLGRWLMYKSQQH